MEWRSNRYMKISLGEINWIQMSVLVFQWLLCIDFFVVYSPLSELMSQPLLRKLEVATGLGDAVHLSPSAFDPYQTAYRLQVAFDQLVVRVRAVPFSDEIIIQVEGAVLEPDHW